MNMRILVIFFLVSVSDLSHALYGARPVQGVKFDGVVSLVFDDPDHGDAKGKFCQAVLISSTKVITAAHCIEGIGRNIYEDEDPLTLTYHPEFVAIQASGQTVRARRIDFSPSYFEEVGLAGEDLAMIELEKPITTVRAYKILPKSELKTGLKILLVANKKVANTTLKNLKIFPQASLLITDGAKSGVCQGDSGGAMLAEKNGQLFLAGVLIYSGKGCEVKNGMGYYPRRNF